MKAHSLALLSWATWASITIADPPPPYPRVSTSISLHPESVSVLPDEDYHTWIIADGTGSSQFSVDGLSFTLAAQGLDANEPLGGITGSANEAVYTTPFASYGERLVGSGVTTVADSGSLKLTISGLPDGQYWLSSWFNAWEQIDRPAAVHVSLNGLGKAYLRAQTARAETIFDASLNIIDIRGGTAEVVYRSYTTVQGGNIFFTGFEINGINAFDEIAYPSPANREEGIAAPSGEVLATWQISRDALPLESQDYNIYFGTSHDELDSVALGHLETNYLFTGLDSGATYYWRVDTRWDSNLGNVYSAGRTLQFTVA